MRMPNTFLAADLIAIPDFAAGAMENWGLITYRESSILYDPLETSSAAHQWVAIVIAHELAHQVRSLTILTMQFLLSLLNLNKKKTIKSYIASCY
jgi:hypothetical protein